MSDKDIFTLAQLQTPPLLSGTKVRLSSTYGSPAEYAQAIDELRVAFPAEDVSTDFAVLDAHGRVSGYGKSECLSLAYLVELGGRLSVSRLSS